MSMNIQQGSKLYERIQLVLAKKTIIHTGIIKQFRNEYSLSVVM